MASFDIILGQALGEDKIRTKQRRVRVPVEREIVHKRTFDIYVPQYESWRNRNGQVSCGTGIVLGCYLAIYKQTFGEEDPEWAGDKNGIATIATSYIQRMMRDLKTKAEELVEYVEELLPLWAKAMKTGETFPNSRPTYKTFFQNRHTWAQRYSYYQRWKSL